MKHWLRQKFPFAGISIGAINGALIVGNEPKARVEKLRAFWEALQQNRSGTGASGRVRF
jgi:NTE family protein